MDDSNDWYVADLRKTSVRRPNLCCSLVTVGYSWRITTARSVRQPIGMRRGAPADALAPRLGSTGPPLDHCPVELTPLAAPRVDTTRPDRSRTEAEPRGIRLAVIPHCHPDRMETSGSVRYRRSMSASRDVVGNRRATERGSASRRRPSASTPLPTRSTHGPGGPRGCRRPEEKSAELARQLLAVARFGAGPPQPPPNREFLRTTRPRPKPGPVVAGAHSVGSLLRLYRRRPWTERRPELRLISHEAIATTMIEPITAPITPPQSNLSSSPIPSSSVKMK